jgi:hypothetical protein
MLTPKHQADLASSGLTPRQMDIAGHFSADQDTAKELVGCAISGLILNYCDPFGKPYLKKEGQRFYRIKPDWGDLKTDDSPKYLSPKGEGCRPYFSRLYPNNSSDILGGDNAIRAKLVEIGMRFNDSRL